MIDFFKNLNFPRSVILLSLIASCVLGWFVYKGSERLSETAFEKQQAPKVVQQIHQLGFSVEELSALYSNEGLAGAEDDVELYVRRIAKERAVAVGDVEVRKNSRSIGQGLEDVIYTLRPIDTEASFSRLSLGNFLYRLEGKSNRVVVTKIELTPGNGRLRPGEIGDDRWDYVIEVTTRQREGQS